MVVIINPHFKKALLGNRRLFLGKLMLWWC